MRTGSAGEALQTTELTTRPGEDGSYRRTVSGKQTGMSRPSFCHSAMQVRQPQNARSWQ